MDASGNSRPDNGYIEISMTRVVLSVRDHKLF
jgi:hypothetical protein